MQELTVIFTKRMSNPISWLIRWAIPQTRLYIARSSHAMVLDGDHVIEAHMLYGVRRVPLADAIKGATVVGAARYAVRDAAKGCAWFRSQICTYKPAPPSWLPKWAQAGVAVIQRLLHNNYDFKGALGLGMAPNRDWQDPVAWHCYEGVARALLEAGLDVFADTGFITETTLLAVRHVPGLPVSARVA